MKTQLTLAAFLVAALPTAHAIPSLWLSDGSTTVTVADGSGLDSNPLAGVVTYNGPVGNIWTLNVTTGVTTPYRGSVGAPQMDLNSVNASSSVGGSLVMRFSHDAFTAGPGTYVAEIGGTTDGSVTYATYAGPTLFSTAIPLTVGGPFTHVFSDSQSGGLGTLATPYALTEEVTLVHEGEGLSSFDMYFERVPDAGASIALLVPALAGLGLFARMRRR